MNELTLSEKQIHHRNKVVNSRWSWKCLSFRICLILRKSLSVSIWRFFLFRTFVSLLLLFSGDRLGKLKRDKMRDMNKLQLRFTAEV